MENIKELTGASRVLALFSRLMNYPEGVGLHQLSEDTGIPKPTLHRILQTLKQQDWVVALGDGSYAISATFVARIQEFSATRPDDSAINECLNKLVDDFHEASHLAIRQGDQVVYLYKANPKSGGVQLSSSIGGANPCYCTAVGKLLLSLECKNIDELAKIVGKGPFPKKTRYTLTSLEELWAEIEDAKHYGFASDNQENEEGVNCIAVKAPLLINSSNAAAISVSGLAFRTPMEQLRLRAGHIQDIIKSTLNGVR